MKGIFRSFFCFFFLINHFTYGANVNFHPQPGLQEIINLAKEYRPDPTQPRLNEKKRKEAIRSKVCSKLPHYGKHETAAEIIAAFLKDYFHEKKLSYEIMQNVRRAPTRQKDLVFFIKDGDGNLQLVVKAFLYPRMPGSLFLLELSALDFLRHLKCPSLLPVHPLAVGMGEAGGIEYALLLETAASGMRIDDYIKRYATATDPHTRSQNYEQLKKAFIRIGNGLAELHSHRSKKSGKLDKLLIDRFKAKRSKILHNAHICDCLKEMVNLKDFDAYIKETVEKAYKTPLYFTFSHRDTNLGNLIYDEKLDKLYFIDVAYLHYSISIKGEPLADGLHDLMRVEESLSKKRGLTHEEREDLIDLFHGVYQEKSKHPIEWCFFRFHQDYKKLGKLIYYQTYQNIEDELERTRAKNYFEGSLLYFKNMVEDRKLHNMDKINRDGK